MLFASTLALTFMGLHALWEVSLNGGDTLYIFSWWWSPPLLSLPAQLMQTSPDVVFDQRVSWPASACLPAMAITQILFCLADRFKAKP